MTVFSRVLRAFAPALAPALALVALPLSAQPEIAEVAPDSTITSPTPRYARPDDPWIYRGTDIPVDEEWLMGEMPNGLRYAVRHNAVPPGQVSMRVAIDAGSLHEEESERGFAHLVEHLTFRQSRYFGDGEAIPHFQRLGASLGNDTNATTSPTQTVYKLDLPNARRHTLEESVRLFAGMIQEPALSPENLAADVPIVLAERRDMAGSGRRIAEAQRSLFFAGQRLAERGPIGTVETLESATAEDVRAFHRRWYRPENATVVMVGDADPLLLAALVERYFGDWQVPGEPVPEPDFGTPQAPADAPAANPVGETRVVVEPGQPRGPDIRHPAALRAGARQSRIQSRAADRFGGAVDYQPAARERARARADIYLYAGIEQEDVSRSSDGTYIAFAPLTDDWESALDDVRAVIADALDQPPTRRTRSTGPVSQFDVALRRHGSSSGAYRRGSKLADDLVNALDIREAVAAPETFLSVFRGMKDRFTPETILEHTQRLFEGEVIRAMLLTPEPRVKPTPPNCETRCSPRSPAAATAGDERTALSFADLPPIGTPAEPVQPRTAGRARGREADLGQRRARADLAHRQRARPRHRARALRQWLAGFRRRRGCLCRARPDGARPFGTGAARPGPISTGSPRGASSPSVSRSARARSNSRASPAPRTSPTSFICSPPSSRIRAGTWHRWNAPRRAR